MNTNLLCNIALAGTLLLLSNCTKDEAAQPATFEATQGLLDGAHVLLANDKTGPFVQKNADGGLDTIPLNNVKLSGEVDNESPDPNKLMRMVMTNFNRVQNIPSGSIAIHKVFEKTDRGVRGKLAGIAVMVKHPAGYFSEGGDYEYMLLDPASVTGEHPNGQLSSAGFRGKKSECGDCHLRAGEDHVFLN